MGEHRTVASGGRCERQIRSPAETSTSSSTDSATPLVCFVSQGVHAHIAAATQPFSSHRFCWCGMSAQKGWCT
ncbi:hypothetical protein, unlikely [Trypanosoma brucei gambiense DAL972]|uniref:Uncharacterized protein n=1 Tax=Trypanosoma brucei gambiense (strain MHOM/CI/86/DAL972) TaxID=679716 RepID=C9ZYB8_TRYB9|nr:hypothetical protein, unlikely [Trypanosoma brucei gambiense DAL972]CBH14417.1 hypothetical protein, unlikely [Trypanosoma brucei gambiense DAL972]|eukprot:XP_011776683.1 hypothetical protein, unlikely [Trypanosoma brucei gambiense DAL972]